MNQFLEKKEGKKKNSERTGADTCRGHGISHLIINFSTRTESYHCIYFPHRLIRVTRRRRGVILRVHLRLTWKSTWLPRR